jgi:hypothetical protein
MGRRTSIEVPEHVVEAFAARLFLLLVQYTSAVEAAFIL